MQQQISKRIDTKKKKHNQNIDKKNSIPAQASMSKSTLLTGILYNSYLKILQLLSSQVQYK